MERALGRFARQSAAASATRAALALLACWRDRARERRQLARLDARGLADIGITRSEAARECAKPFWRV